MIKLHLALILNIILAFFTLLALISPFISPHHFWFFGFLGYGIPLLLPINFGFIIWWLFRKSNFAFISTAMLLAGGVYLKSTFGFRFDTGELKTHDIEVLSYNVRYFNTGNNATFKDENGLLQMVSHISQLNSDILCFQEFYNNNHSSFSNTKAHFLNNGYRNFQFGDINISNKNNAGLAIFSRFPLVKKGSVNFSHNTGNKAIFADLKIGNDTIRIYNVHFQSLNLSSDPDLYQIFVQLKEGFSTRPLEVDDLTDHVRTSPHPAILCGDFNDLPFSYTYQQFRRFLKNSFEKAGSGIGATYHGKIPFIRIDNQFSSKAVIILEHRVLTDFRHTDHFPVLVRYKLPL